MIYFFGLLISFYALTLISKQGQVIDLTNQKINGLPNLSNIFEGVLMNLGLMKNIDKNLLNNANVKAFLAVIRRGEGTADANGYRRIFGGQLFSDFSKHPNILVKKSGYSSTAAGAYQFLFSTWKETAALMGLSDFSPKNQDLGAIGRIAARGALADVVAGRFEIAVKKCALEWASLPFSPYGQPTQNFADASRYYKLNGGSVA